MRPEERAYWRTLDSDRDRLAFERMDLVEKARVVGNLDAKTKAKVAEQLERLKGRG